jgi:hypothetical protein
MFANECIFGPGKMIQKIQYSYICLAFFKEDIQKLVRLFQTHLQDVDCVIDNQHILNDIQFEQYVAQLESINPSYQIRSLEAQGAVVVIQDGADVQQSEPPRINLSINKKQATLIVWKEVDNLEPGVVSEMRALFASRVNRVSQASVMIFTVVFIVISGVFSGLGKAGVVKKRPRS